MKTKQTKTSIISSTHRRRGAWSALIIPLAALVFAGAVHGQTHTKCEPCIGTARYVQTASLSEALADYNIALANANNAATTAEQAAGAKQAASDYRKAVALARAQFQERSDLCADLGEERYNPVIRPADFLTVAQTAAAPNKFFPLVPGTTFNYRAVTPEGTETIEFTVTRDTRKILGVTTIEVHDIVKLNGSVIEDTLDWFAQDRSGNVWYFGENVADYEDGLIVSTAGSWEAGVAGAKPGIIMFANPVVGKVYRQEMFLGEAEDASEVIAVNQKATVPAGTYTGCLKTEDFTPIAPDASELKFYAPGIGNVLTINPDTGKRTELISIRKN